jgi:hypothetical protein
MAQEEQTHEKEAHRQWAGAATNAQNGWGNTTSIF